MIILIALSQSVCMSISCECLHEHFMSIVDVKKSQSSQPPHGRVHSRLTHCAQNSCPQSIVILSHQYLSSCSKPHLMVSLWLCAVCNWSFACQQLFSEYVILKATNRILFKKRRLSTPIAPYVVMLVVTNSYV